MLTVNSSHCRIFNVAPNPCKYPDVSDGYIDMRESALFDQFERMPDAQQRTATTSSERTTVETTSTEITTTGIAPTESAKFKASVKIISLDRQHKRKRQ
jgi:hypothetical protein